MIFSPQRGMILNMSIIAVAMFVFDQSTQYLSDNIVAELLSQYKPLQLIEIDSIPPLLWITLIA